MFDGSSVLSLVLRRGTTSVVPLKHVQAHAFRAVLPSLRPIQSSRVPFFLVKNGVEI